MLAAACGDPSSEYQLLDAFFEASRVRDTAVVSNIASVMFDPVTDGIIQTFAIVAVGAERPGNAGQVVKDVTVEAPVRSLEGASIPRTLVFTMERAGGRWRITAFR